MWGASFWEGPFFLLNYVCWKHFLGKDGAIMGWDFVEGKVTMFFRTIFINLLCLAQKENTTIMHMLTFGALIFNPKSSINKYLYQKEMQW